jgi:glucose/arabinose dehydrogenase
MHMLQFYFNRKMAFVLGEKVKKMMRKRIAVIGLLLMVFLLASGVHANGPMTAPLVQPDPATVSLNEIITGLTRPVYVAGAGDGSGRLFVAEQIGLILVWKDGALLDTPFIDLQAVVSPVANYSERGLLGLAFDPHYADNGYFYVDYTDRRGNSAVARYQVSSDNPDVADPSSATIILTQEQPFPNHNGGQIAFGPDGDLYIGFGDGGSGGDPLGNAQNLNTWLGKILRINVASLPYTVPADNPFASQPDAKPEIWAYGLRNPWRFSFDRGTGDLYIGDVGQDTWEEVDYQPAGDPGGENYGWNKYEGTHIYQGGGTAGLTMPITDYQHGPGCSVSGGYVYRGQALPNLQGVYFYSDWCSGLIKDAYKDTNGAWNFADFIGSNRQVSSFGEGDDSELYVVDYAGAVLRFDPAG